MPHAALTGRHGEPRPLSHLPSTAAPLGAGLWLQQGTSSTFRVPSTSDPSVPQRVQASLLRIEEGQLQGGLPMEGSKWQIGPSMSAGCGLGPMPAASLELMGLYSPRGITRGVQIVAGSSSSLRGCRSGHFLATAIPPPKELVSCSADPPNQAYSRHCGLNLNLGWRTRLGLRRGLRLIVGFL